MVDVGAGPAILLIPGIQGRWEWVRPAVDALSTRFRVVTGSLPPEARSFDQLVGHVDSLMDAAKLSSAVICGVSFGGLVALRYAASRSRRVRALILVSAPGPRWKAGPEMTNYLRWPKLYSPLFALRAIGRFRPELSVTFPDVRTRVSFCLATLSRLIGAPATPSRMSLRAQMAQRERFDNDCAHVSAPTLVVTGEEALDRVVNTAETMEYVSAIRGAQFQLFENTGHLGTISAPDRFATIVSIFLEGVSDSTWPTTSAY